MELKETILGFLDWQPLTGYELKKMFAELEFLPWGGNNNQIYKSLIELDEEDLVIKDIIQQENLPAQKRYRATKEGREKLKEAVLHEAEAPVFKNDFLLHLLWANCLTHSELISIIDQYQDKVTNELLLYQGKIKKDRLHASRNYRETFIWEMIMHRRAEYLQNELNWLTRLRNGLANKSV